jgi:hypothetical protein
MRYTYYENKDYSVSSWLDAFITLLALEGITSLLRFIYNFPLYKLSEFFAIHGTNMLGDQNFALLSGLVLIAFTITVEAWVCKVRYPGLPYSRILTYLLVPKVLIFGLNYALMTASCAL